jgi:hypothetical protein
MSDESDVSRAAGDGEHGTNEGALWGARFASGPSPELARLSKSTHFDWQLAPYDLAGSRAHARALAAAGYLNDDELAAMLEGLDLLGERVASGEITPADTDEDVHGALETALIGIVGPELGGKLRAGRSRNDQIATLVRLYLKDHAATIGQQLVHLIDALAAQADDHRTSRATRTSSGPSPSRSRTTSSRTAGRCLAISSDWSTGRSGRMSRPTAGERSPGRRSASMRHPSPVISVLRHPARTRSTEPQAATWSPSSRSWPR